ncbi:MAG: GntR family transcriptional regulator [Reinekea sp.]|jgi:DNA-binding GntR family transcriptional regulator
MTQSDQTFQQLLDAIIKGEIQPGSRLRETELASEFGIGRGPLREALQRLESRKLVTKVPHVGAQVVDFNLPELVEIYQLRENLEGLACELAANNMTDAELDELEVLLQKHQAFVEQSSGAAYIQQDSDLDFHFKIIQCSGNSWLVQLLCDELYHRVRMYRYQSAHQKSRPARAIKEHTQIFEALRARDGELASLLMRRHISAARQNLISVATPIDSGD